MAEYIGGKEKLVNVDEPIIFENKTDSNYEVSAGIVFHKGGVYEVSIEGYKTTISKISEPKQGHWIDTDNYYMRWKCSLCGCHTRDAQPAFCPYCGAKMEGEE